MGYVSAFLRWFDALSAGTQAIFVLVATFAVPAIVWVIQRIWRFAVSLSSGAGPDVLLLAPAQPLIVRWVPKEQVGMNWWKEGLGPTDTDRGAFAFGLKNLGDHPITQVVMKWKIGSDVPIRRFFMAAEVFQPYSPQIIKGMYTFGTPPQPGTSHGIGRPAVDERTTSIDYCRATPNTDDTLSVVWPAALDHSFLFRITGASYPPHDIMDVLKGPPIDVVIRYRDPIGRYTREFVIESEITRFPDLAWGIICGPDVKPEHRWEHNFRGRVKFTVRRAKP